MSIPNAVLKRMHVDATAEIAKRDAPMLEGLRKAGFNGTSSDSLNTMPIILSPAQS